MTLYNNAFLVAALAGFLGACGSAPSQKVNATGTCSVSVRGSEVACVNMSITGAAQGVSSTDLQSALNSSCSTAFPSATFVPGLSCSQTDAVGFCKWSRHVSAQDGSGTVTFVLVYKQGSVSSLTEACHAAGGTFSTSYPN